MKIRTIAAEQARPDMIVADDIFSFSGQLIIPKGTVLTNRSITRLKFYSITDLKIVVDEAQGEEIEELTDVQEAAGEPQETVKKPEETTFRQTVRQSVAYKEFNKNVLDSAKTLQNSLTNFVEHVEEGVNVDTLLTQTKETITKSRNPLHTFHMLQSMRDYDDATFVHCLNVSIICNAFGQWLGMSGEELDILTLAGLLHDIGKMKIPEDIVKKPGALTDAEYAMIKLHPRRGYNLLSTLPIDERVKKVALMHHERCDGTGYPAGIKGDSIDEFAKIVAIVDIYDAMTSARVYRGPLCPFEVLNIYETEGYQRFDPKYLYVFMENIVNTYMHNDVRLSDGRIGEIIMINKNELTRPIVKVGNAFVDLCNEKALSIVEIL